MQKSSAHYNPSQCDSSVCWFQEGAESSVCSLCSPWQRRLHKDGQEQVPVFRWDSFTVSHSVIQKYPQLLRNLVELCRCWSIFSVFIQWSFVENNLLGFRTKNQTKNTWVLLSIALHLEIRVSESGGGGEVQSPHCVFMLLRRSWFDFTAGLCS